MDAQALPLVAKEVLAAVGGRPNVASNSVCMTRLRLRLRELGAVDFERLLSTDGVLGVAPYHEDGIEVVFGPAIVDEVFRVFSELTGLESDLRVFRQPQAATSPEGSSSAIAVSAQEEHESSLPGGLEPEEAQWLRDIVGLGGTDSDAEGELAEPPKPPLPQDRMNGIRRLLERVSGRVVEPQEEGDGAPSSSGELACLIINGPNLNLLGVREPGIYGSDSYTTLVSRCEKAAKSAGFARVECYQSNHEGSIVDKIQAAMGEFDGIVINPGAYTHTSVALLDALKAVRIPAVEVHISEVDKREEFRQVSYVRLACFETITGMGIAGYEKAIQDLYDHLS